MLIFKRRTAALILFIKVRKLVKLDNYFIFKHHDCDFSFGFRYTTSFEYDQELEYDSKLEYDEEALRKLE